MTPKRYFFIVLLFLYTPLFIKGYANTTKEFSDVIVPEFPLQVKFANELVDLDRLDMYERFDREAHHAMLYALVYIISHKTSQPIFSHIGTYIERRESPDRFLIFGRY